MSNDFIRVFFSDFDLINARIQTYNLSRNYDVHIKDIITCHWDSNYIDIEFHDNLDRYCHVQSFSDGAKITLRNGLTMEYKAE